MGQPTPPPATDPGATPPADPATPPTTTDPATPPAATAGDGLGEAGKKALAEERAARKDLEKQLAALQPLAGLAAALGVKGGDGKTDTQQLAEQVEAMRKQMTESDLRAMRLEVAAEKSLTPAQAARLVGSTREELAKDADALKALFPAAPATASGQPGTPAPDPSQGARGGINDLQAALKAAQEKKNTAEVIRLKTAIAAAQAK